jgi:small-conductance mechanosensitive channel
MEVHFMSQSFWDSEVAEAPQPETPVASPQAEPPAEPVSDAASLALSADDFAALEQRILRAVELVKAERQARAAAEERAAKAEAQLAGQSPLVDQMQEEVRMLRAERDHVRQRVERLLSQLDALEL